MNLKEKIINCINLNLMEKEKIQQLGINGTVVYPYPNAPVTKKGDDFYVKELEVMTGENYNLYTTPKSGRDRLIKDAYSVPEPPIGWFPGDPPA